MKNNICAKIRPLLVDYSDGELPADQSRPIGDCPNFRVSENGTVPFAAIADHLAECPACRAELRLLERSLALARQAWNEPACAADEAVMASVEKARAKQPRRRVRSAMWIGGGVAAGAAVVLLLCGRTASVPPDRPDAARPAADEVDVMEQIAREGRSARLAASVRLLAEQPSLKQYKEETERYLRDHYADTAAVRTLDRQEKVPE